MRSTHLEITHLTRRYRRLVDSLPPSGPTAEDVLDLRRTLYGLDAILRLHNAQEDEIYDWLGSAAPAGLPPGRAGPHLAGTKARTTGPPPDAGSE